MFQLLTKPYISTALALFNPRSESLKLAIATIFLCCSFSVLSAEQLPQTSPLPDSNFENHSFETVNIVAKTGNPVAQRILASMYEHGDGVTPDMSQAIKWYRSAAKLNDDIAQFYLGYIYYQAIGLEQDQQMAFHWFSKAAEQGNADFQYNLGNLYRYGEGVTANVDTAIQWYTLAAEQDQSNAQMDLASLYNSGEEVTKNLVEAYLWYALALENINTQSELKTLEENMSELQLKTARQKTEDWISTNRSISN